MGKRKRKGNSRPSNQGKRPGGKTPMQWVEFIRKNDSFEQYYKVQQIVPDEEFPAFIEAIQRELPSTFRITGTRSHAQELLNAIRKFFLDDLQSVQLDGGKADPPTPIAWYPDELAWQINLTKKFIRKSSSMGKFHNFLVHETETGNISRQEAVSMIPPLLLDIKPGQKILDACAAPGSKTVQLIELLHGEESSGIPDGLVVANELQNKRCYMLVHQSKRLHSPCCLITNHDAALFPTLFIKGEDEKKMPLIFDRILCDVPCSGDGTLRKNPMIWRKWTPQLGLSLFRIQLRILARAVEMLATGGRIVYSTCTLNPIEDEAVICTLLQKAEGAMELVDVSSHLPNLKRSPGLKTWKVMTKDMIIVDNCHPGTEYYSKGFKPEMLAPSEEVVNKLHIERCMRIYPHQQDTGGFFIAVLEKKSPAPWENGKRCSDNPRLLPWESMADWQRKKEEKNKKEDTKASLLTAGEISDLDKHQCKSEETTVVETASGSYQENETCEDDISNQVTNSAYEHLDEVDEQDPQDHVQGDEENQADEQQSSSWEKGSSPNNSASDNDNTAGQSAQLVQPPRKKAKVEMKGYKEDPFVFLKEDDEHWPLIKKFYGIEEFFPTKQLLVRSVAGKKRNIYLVSKAVKEVMEMIDDSHKVVNTGMKVIARADVDNVGCNFRLMQEGIEAMLPFINKRKVMITQNDVVILLTQDRPFISEFSSGTRERLNNIEEQGCIVYLYEPNGPQSFPEDTIGCRIVFCGWKAKVSTRVQISKFDKAHYRVLCGIPPEEKQKERKRTLEQQEETEYKEGEVTEPNDDEQQAGFVGDILNLEAPEGSLDVGFI